MSRMTLASKLVLDAAASAGNDDPETYMRLRMAIARCLQGGNQETLEEALCQADSDEETFDALLDAIHQETTTDAGWCDTATGAPLEVALLALPVMLMVNGDQTSLVPQRLGRATLGQVADLFSHLGGGAGAEARVLPELWQAEELYNLPFSRVFRLTQACGAGRGGEPAAPIFKTTPAPSCLEAGQVTLCLRFLLAGIVYRASGGVPPGLDAEASSQWQETVAAHLQAGLGCLVEAFEPELLYDALASGWLDYHLLAHALERDRLLEAAGLLPIEVKAVISVHGEDDRVTQVRIGYYPLAGGRVALIGGNVWPVAPFDRPEILLDHLFGQLERAQLGDIEIAPSFQQENYDPESGAPIYARPAEDGDVPRPLVPPHRGQLH